MDREKYELTDDQRTMLADLAAAFVTKANICRIMQMNHEFFICELNDPDSIIYQTYYGAFLKSKFELQRKVVELGKAGSSPAQAMALKFLTDLELENEQL